MTHVPPELVQHPDYWIGRFSAMACPCEVLITIDSSTRALEAVRLAQLEALRIEQKFSRYRDDNIIYSINHSRGKRIEVDEETANMLDFATQCHQLSDGRFDITSGVLRKIWKFDGSDNLPSKQDVEKILIHIGWNKVKWDRPFIELPEGMEIDLGGIGKEYAVDQSARIIAQAFDAACLVNYGGDIFATKPRPEDNPWIIGVDDPRQTGEKSIGEIQLFKGGLATSGDSRRFLINDGIRYSHILDPLTGWPVPDAPHSVTVIADTCLEAGMLSTFAMLQGSGAADFLKAQNVQYWCA